MHCRSVRKQDLIFGGIQVIGASSFIQLPPVPSSMDPGFYCFQSKHFKVVFPHRITLDEVMCQDELDLIKAINELCLGKPSIQTVALLKSLKHEIVIDEKMVYIFGTNFDVDMFIHDKLSSLHGVVHVVRAKDLGNCKYLKRSSASKILALKNGCRVIIIRNLPNGLVNGLTGHVIH